MSSCIQFLCNDSRLHFWDGAVPAFCFRNLISTFIIFKLIVVDAYFIGKFCGHRASRSTLERRISILRKILTLFILLCSVINLLLLNLWNNSLPILGFIHSSIQIFAWILHLVFLQIFYCGPFRCSTRGPLSVHFTFLMTIVTTCFDLFTSVKIFEGASVILHIHYAGITLNSIVLFFKIVYILTWLPASRVESVDQNSSLGTAEENIGLFNRLTFFWVWKLILKGYRSNIHEINDLHKLPKALQVAHNEKKLLKAIANIRQKYGTSRNIALHAIWQTFGWRFLMLGVLKLVADCLQFVGPILLGHIVSFVKNPEEPVAHGYYYAIGMFFATILHAFFDAFYHYEIGKMAFQASGGLASIVYKKTVSVPYCSLSSMKSGEIIDIMSTDVERIGQIQHAHELWSLPVQFIIALTLVYFQVGLSFLICIAYGIIILPVTQYLTIKIEKFETKFMAFKDERVNLMNEILKGFRVVKLFAWHQRFRSKVDVIRSKEMQQLKYSKYLDAICVVSWQLTPLIMTIFTFTCYIYLGNELTASKAFTCIALFGMLMMPLNAFPWVIGGMIQCWVSLKRIQKLFSLQDFDSDNYFTSDERMGSGDIDIANGSFKWESPGSEDENKSESVSADRIEDNMDVSLINKDEQRTELKQGELEVKPRFKLSNVSISVHQGQFIGIMGKVGSGKSTLLYAIIGELSKTNGSIKISEYEKINGFGIYMQESWIQHGTIRDNILFGKEYDDAFYHAVIESCALSEDIALLPSKDLTEVGENGLRLSGGQKARLTLARAIYQDKNIYLLDDPFAAVDADVATHIYKYCLRGLLKQKTIILISHHVNFLRDADKIVVLEDGKVVQQGPPREVLNISFVRSISGDGYSAEKTNKDDEEPAEDSKDKLVDDEKKESGAVKGQVYLAFWRAAGSLVGLIFIFFLIMMQVSQNASDLWLAHWVSSIDDGIKNTSSHANHTGKDTAFYLTIFGSIGASNVLFTIGRAFLFAYGCIKAAKKLHQLLLSKVLRGTMRFFEATPIGRILNRFSSDVNSVDDLLPFLLNIVMSDIVALLGSLIVITYSLVWIILVIIPLAAVYFIMQNIYRKTSREVKRIISVSLSPIYSLFSESISGIVTIRGFSESSRFSGEVQHKINDYVRSNFAEIAAYSWFGLYLEFIGVILVTAVSFLVIIYHHLSKAEAGFMGLAIANALAINSILSDLVIHFAETEKLMVSVERVSEYIETIECENEDGVINPPLSWPSQGIVCLENVYFSYKEDLPQVLKGISFQSYPGEKLAIVGRTGSGKSTLVSLMFRINEQQMGEIFIDGVNISHIPLNELRSKIAIIPQEPFLFTSNLRENLDPTDKYTDDKIWDVLKLCQLEDTVRALPNTLMSDVGEQGCEFSTGQKQLVCLARAILKDSKVLCIDEATASVDLDTDSLIQQTIQTVFKNHTVITIAHRLDTIMHCDRVIVMSNGEIVELDSPKALLSKPESYFYKMQNSNAIL